MDASNSETDDDSGWNCSVHPSVFFLLGTLILTICATGMLCASIMTDHWEEVTWSQEKLENFTNMSLKLQWLLEHKVAKLTDEDERKPLAFLVPMHGGIWTLCLSLTEEELFLLARVKFPSVPPCVNYLAGTDRIRTNFDRKNDWQHSKYAGDVDQVRHLRMQNLSISCALVCLIILGSAALVGAFGICQHQISAVLVTGVMYLLAASFAIFTLMIIHLKRLHTKPRMDYELVGGVDGVVSIPGIYYPREILTARLFTTSWSLDLGWGGVTLCVMTSILWILLSKIMRFNPISSMIN